MMKRACAGLERVSFFVWGCRALAQARHSVSFLSPGVGSPRALCARSQARIRPGPGLYGRARAQRTPLSAIAPPPPGPAATLHRRV